MKKEQLERLMDLLSIYKRTYAKNNSSILEDIDNVLDDVEYTYDKEEEDLK